MDTKPNYKKEKYTFEEYLVMEEEAVYKSEFNSGKIVAMAGGSLEHGAISSNINYALSDGLRKKKSTCRTLDSNVRVFIEDYDKGVYPDTFVICDKPNFKDNRKDVITNPLLVVEVLSPSTEGYDRGEKFTQYRSLPSFKEYVLITQEKAKVESWYKEDENIWRISNATGLDATIYLYSLGIEISLADIYYLVDFDAEKPTTT